MEVTIPSLSASGELGERTVDAGRFRRRGKRVLLKEYVHMAEARKRVGTHSALTRAEVSGTTAKMFRQKGTGNARRGNRKANMLRGGGMAFAKKPRDYGWSMPKRARRAALAAALRGKLEDGEVSVVESFDFPEPSTRMFVGILERLGVEGSFLVVPAAHDPNVWKSCRNVPGQAYRIAPDLNAYEVLKQRRLILDEAALALLEERFDG